MKKILIFIFACVMLVSFNSCERSAEVEEPATEEEELEEDEDEDDSTEDDSTTPPVQQSPIKGLWEYKVTGMVMTLDFGDEEVEYRCHTDLYDALAIYKGTYTIEDKDITLEFTSLTSKPSNVDFYAPEDLPKDAVLKDEKTIVYIEKSYIRKE